MSKKNKKQFGVWMDSHHATVVGRQNPDSDDFSVLGHCENPLAEPNSSEKTAHHAEKTLQHKYFKELTLFMQNAEEIHITGTGTSQEQFMHYLAETAQFRDTVTDESTSNKMSDENLSEYIGKRFN